VRPRRRILFVFLISLVCLPGLSQAVQGMSLGDDVAGPRPGRHDSPAGGPLATGRFILTGLAGCTDVSGTQLDSQWTCFGFTLDRCPESSNLPTVYLPGVTGVIAIRSTSSITGAVMFFSGSDGTAWWSGTSPGFNAFFTGLANHGIQGVLVRWTSLATSWQIAPSGHEVGPRFLACRPATVIHAVRTTSYPSMSGGADTPCGFCISGNSGGGSEVAYALSAYGLDGEVDGLFPTSGPPHASIDKGCKDPPVAGYAYTTENALHYDNSYGYATLTHCTVDNALLSRWQDDQVNGLDGDFSYSDTRVIILLGFDDTETNRNHPHDYCNLVTPAPTDGQEWVLYDTGHQIGSQNGLTALTYAISNQYIGDLGGGVVQHGPDCGTG
jgi:hypothetical protein